MAYLFPPRRPDVFSPNQGVVGLESPGIAYGSLHQNFDQQLAFHKQQQNHFAQNNRGRHGHRSNSNGNPNRNDKNNLMPFFCDMCDRGFKFQEKLTEHLAEHIKCSVKDCKFEGHYKIVEKHFQMQHMPGSKKIGSLDSPQDIAKWREARRANYPTVANVSRKRQLRAARQESGQVLKTKNFGKFGGRGRQRSRGRGGRGRGCHRNWSSDIQREPDAKKAKTDDRSHDPNNDPLSYVLDSDEDPNEECSTDIKPCQSSAGKSSASMVKVMSSGTSLGSLASLASQYGSLSESEEEQEVPSTTRCQKGSSGSPNSNKSNKNVVAMAEGNRERNRYKKKQRPNHNDKFNNNKKPTLLEMLLAKEIRHERNVMLQCVRHVVKSDFFGIENQERNISN